MADEIVAAAETTQTAPEGTQPATTSQPNEGTQLAPPREGSPLGTAAATPAEGEKPEGDKPEGEKPEGEGEATAPATAEDLAKAIVLPEGAQPDEALMGKFTAFAAEAKLTPEQAQGLAGMYFEAQETLVQQLATAQQKAWDTVIDGWKSAIEADPDIGGSKMEAVQTVLGKALDEYGTPATRQAFENTAAGWNPDIIKFCYKMANALSEGRPVAAGRPTPKGPIRMADALYGEGPMADVPTQPQT